MMPYQMIAQLKLLVSFLSLFRLWNIEIMITVMRAVIIESIPPIVAIIIQKNG